MLGQNPPEQQQSLFSYNVNLEGRIHSDHPLREIKALLNLAFVVPAVRPFYGRSGHVSLDPEVIVKLMFLLFYYNIASERQLMEQLPYRLDFLWFLGFNLDSPIPDHSVLSKARARWGPEVFKMLFLRTVEQCVKAGLVDGRLLHADSTMIKANASKESLTERPQFLAELYRQEERKLEVLPAALEVETQISSAAAVPLTVQEPAPSVAGDMDKALARPQAQPKLEVLPKPPALGDSAAAAPKGPKLERVSSTDPDAQLARAKNNLIELLYKEHRLTDDAHGVITAVEVTRSQVHDGSKLALLTHQHEQNTGIQAAGFTLSGDQHYGTIENYRYCREQGIRAHLAPAGAHLKEQGKFPTERFTYDSAADRYRCPAGHSLVRHQFRPEYQHVVYRISQGSLCAQCPLRAQCTKGKAGRTLIRHFDQALLDEQRQETLGAAGRYSRKRRKHVAEGSFATAANEHGSKRARWRRLWRQQIQSWMIGAVQNLKLLLANRTKDRPKATGVLAAERVFPAESGCQGENRGIFGVRAQLWFANAARACLSSSGQIWLPA